VRRIDPLERLRALLMRSPRETGRMFDAFRALYKTSKEAADKLLVRHGLSPLGEEATEFGTCAPFVLCAWLMPYCTG